MINKDTYKRLTETKKINEYCSTVECGEHCEYCYVGNLYERLAELEDKIENGTLIGLPCKIGGTIYLVPSETQFRLNNIGESFKKHNRVYEMEVYQIYMNKNNYVLYNFEQTASALGSSFGKTWFLTKAEAEARLKELQEKEQ